jgi:uncharacterized membrane protein (DUF485 family)
MFSYDKFYIEYLCMEERRHFNVVLSIAILIAGIGFISLSAFAGRLFYRKRWKLGIAVSTPLLLVVIIVLGCFFYVSHRNNSDSIDLIIKQRPPKDSYYTISGKWKERMDYYSLGWDFVAICTQNNKKVQMLEYIKGDWQSNYHNFGSDIPFQIKTNSKIPNGCVPQLFDLKMQKEFSFSFNIEKRSEIEPVTLYYIHVRMDPMDSPSYWVKTLPIQ